MENVSHRLNQSSSVGETFQLGWMVHKRLEEYLSQNWPPAPFNPKREKQDNNGLEEGKMSAVGERAPTAENWDKVIHKRDPAVDPKVTIGTTTEVTGLSTEIAAYALHVSKVYRYTGRMGKG